MAAVLLNRQAVGYGDAAVAAMSVDGRLFMVFSAFLSDMVRVFSRWQGISLELKIKKVKAGIYFTLWSSIIAAAGIGLAGFLFAPMTMSFF